MKSLAAFLLLVSTALGGPLRIPGDGPLAIPEWIDQDVTTYEKVPVYGTFRVCRGGVCSYVKMQTGWKWKTVQKTVTLSPSRAVPAAAQPTPQAEVNRILALLNPKSTETLVDYGCGDARFLISAVRKYGCRGLGIEVDLERAALAQRLVDQSGVGSRIRIVHADFTSFKPEEIKADIGVAYLSPRTMSKLKPYIENLERFASYQHKPPVADAAQYGDAWVWKKPEEQKVPVAYWGGYAYYGPQCSNPRCAMCQSIRAQLGW